MSLGSVESWRWGRKPSPTHAPPPLTGAGADWPRKSRDPWSANRMDVIRFGFWFFSPFFERVFFGAGSRDRSRSNLYEIIIVLAKSFLLCLHT